MAKAETPVAVARRHIVEAEGRVARQERLIETLVRDKHAAMAEHARQILDVLKRSLELARVHLQLEIDHYGDEPAEAPPKQSKNKK